MSSRTRRRDQYWRRLNFAKRNGLPPMYENVIIHGCNQKDVEHGVIT